MTAIMTPRTAIRLAVRDRLLASLPEWDDRITERRVSMNRVTPLFAAKLPAVLIYAGDERIEENPHADPGLRHRKLDLVVEVVTGGESADETAEKLAFAVEIILDHEETFCGLVEGSKLKSVHVMRHPGKTSQPKRNVCNVCKRVAGCALPIWTPGLILRFLMFSAKCRRVLSNTLAISMRRHLSYSACIMK